METFYVLLAICAGNSPVTDDFPAQRPVTRNFDVFVNLRLNKRLSKELWGWWFETPSHPLWCQCYVSRITSVIPDWNFNEYALNFIHKIKCYMKWKTCSLRPDEFMLESHAIIINRIVLIVNWVETLRGNKYIPIHVWSNYESQAHKFTYMVWQTLGGNNWVLKQAENIWIDKRR